MEDHEAHTEACVSDRSNAALLPAARVSYQKE